MEQRYLCYLLLKIPLYVVINGEYSIIIIGEKSKVSQKFTRNLGYKFSENWQKLLKIVQSFYSIMIL